MNAYHPDQDFWKGLGIAVTVSLLAWVLVTVVVVLSTGGAGS